LNKHRKDSMTVLEHLGELRLRILISAATFIAAAIFCFTRVDYLRYLLVKPGGGMKLFFFSPPEAFMANMRLAAVAGLALAFPVLIYELMAFIFPGLYRHEKKFLLGLTGGAVTLFAGGALFAYYVIVRLVLHFFIQFETERLTPLFNIGDYISFTINLILCCGLFFQLPLAMWILSKIGLITAKTLKRNRKYALLIILVVAAILTPPDIISQILLAIPLQGLYEIGIMVVVFSERKGIKKGAAEEINTPGIGEEYD